MPAKPIEPNTQRRYVNALDMDSDVYGSFDSRKQKAKIQLGHKVKKPRNGFDGNSFVQGWAAALVVLLRFNGMSTADTDELFNVGIGSIKKAEEAKVDESDLVELRKYYA